MTAEVSSAAPARRRVPAAERREELIAAAVHEFAHGGLHGTTVESVARRVGVAQPYVFSLFSNKSAPPPTTARGAPPPTARTRSRRWAAPTSNSC